MPWCPNCRLEYREGFKICNDCEVDLVDELEPEKTEQAEELPNADEIFLISVANDLEANMTEELLEQNGIHVRMKSREPGNIIMGTTYLGIDIYVLSRDYDFAKEVIDNMPTEPVSEEELEKEALQYEPEPDLIDEAEVEEEEQAVPETYLQDDNNGIKSTYINFRWMIAFAFLVIAAIYLIVHLCGAGF